MERLGGREGGGGSGYSFFLIFISKSMKTHLVIFEV